MYSALSPADQATTKALHFNSFNQGIFCITKKPSVFGVTGSWVNHRCFDRKVVQVTVFSNSNAYFPAPRSPLVTSMIDLPFPAPDKVTGRNGNYACDSVRRFANTFPRCQCCGDRRCVISNTITNSTILFWCDKCYSKTRLPEPSVVMSWPAVPSALGVFRTTP